MADSYELHLQSEQIKKEQETRRRRERQEFLCNALTTSPGAVYTIVGNQHVPNKTTQYGNTNISHSSYDGTAKDTFVISEQGLEITCDVRRPIIGRRGGRGRRGGGRRKTRTIRRNNIKKKNTKTRHH
jgi:hypothetical protein